VPFSGKRCPAIVGNFNTGHVRRWIAVPGVAEKNPHGGLVDANYSDPSWPKIRRSEQKQKVVCESEEYGSGLWDIAGETCASSL